MRPDGGIVLLSGNYNLHLLAKETVALNVHLENFQGESREANYSSFKVAGASDKYRMEVSYMKHSDNNCSCLHHTNQKELSREMLRSQISVDYINKS